MNIQKKIIVRRPRKKNIGLIFINRTRSNIFLTLTDMNGQVKTSINAGMVGYTGRAKRATLLYSIFTKKLVIVAKYWDYKYIIIVFKIPLQKAVRNLKKIFAENGIQVLGLSSAYTAAHNGCRFRKARR